MMMPANFSAIAENEMTYVVGGGLVDAIGSVTAPVWNASNVKTFNTNLVTIVGNGFVSKLVGATLGTMFGGVWGSDDGEVSLFGEGGTFTKLFKKADGKDMSGLNKFMTAVGLGAAVYQLGTSNAKTFVGNKKYVASTDTGVL